jgi:hypothetical protein
MQYKLKLVIRNAPKKELLDDIKRVAELVSKNTLTCEDYDKYGKYSSTTIRRRFGSWFSAVEQIGLEKSRTPANIPDLELLKNLQDVWEKLGRQPKYDEMKKPLSKFHAGTYENRFGTWNNSLQTFIDRLSEPEIIDDVEYDDEVKTNKSVITNLTVSHKTKREISDRLRFRILMRDGFSCQSCGKSPTKERGVELHVDHIVPWSKGGETIESNLITKCSKCNLGKGNAFDK